MLKSSCQDEQEMQNWCPRNTKSPRCEKSTWSKAVKFEVAFGRRKWQMGGGGRMAVSLDSVNESEWSQSKISCWDTHLTNFYRLFPVRDQMKALEGSKVKFPCFLGIVHPTIFQRRGLGTLTSRSVQVSGSQSSEWSVISQWQGHLLSCLWTAKNKSFFKNYFGFCS